MASENPDRAEAIFRRGLAHHEQGRTEEAQALYRQALLLEPRHSNALHLLGLIAFQSNRPQLAVELIDEALRINPHSAAACNHRANALVDLRQYDAAIAGYDKAIELKADYAEAHYNRGNAFLDIGRYQQAVQSYDGALALKRDYAEACYNRGLALVCLGRHEAAVASFDAAIALKPNFVDAYNNRGLALAWLNEYEAAIASHDRAIAVMPHGADAHYQRGNVLRTLKRYAAAIASYDRAIAIGPGYKFLFGLRLHTKMQICDWDGFPEEMAELRARIERGEAASPPFPVLTCSDSPELQKLAAQIWVREDCPPSSSLPPIPRRAARGKLRIGYFSADFCDHPVSMLAAGMFECHDRSRFEVTAFSFGPDTRDGMRLRLERTFDRFLDVRERPDTDIALLAREMEIDIAVDLGGFTEGCRAKIFALRAAPLQVSYLGYLGTMSAEYMDYLIADPTIVPAESRGFYSEKIIYLPSYQANDSTRGIAERVFTRTELGLPPAGFVFCCFNANFKVTPGTFSGWMRILSKVPGSVLFLYAGSEAAESNLRTEARRRGVDPDRLVFGGRLPILDYMARYRSADLFLDTLPYNAGTTASDALWAGLPVLTCTGATFASRVAASLLQAIDLPELITTNQEQYEELAVDLATNPQRLAGLRQRLADNRLTSRLFDTERFTRHLEAAYAAIHDRHRAGLPPDHIDARSG